MATSIIGADFASTNAFEPAQWISDFIALGGQIVVSDGQCSTMFGTDRNTPDLVQMLRSIGDTERAHLRAYIARFAAGQMQ